MKQFIANCSDAIQNIKNQGLHNHEKIKTTINDDGTTTQIITKDKAIFSKKLIQKNGSYVVNDGQEELLETYEIKDGGKKGTLTQKVGANAPITIELTHGNIFYTTSFSIQDVHGLMPESYTFTNPKNGHKITYKTTTKIGPDKTKITTLTIEDVDGWGETHTTKISSDTNQVYTFMGTESQGFTPYKSTASAPIRNLLKQAQQADEQRPKIAKNKQAYETLGVDTTADLSTIQQAYKKLALKYHPDKGGTTAKFQEIGSAYEVLKDYFSTPEPLPQAAH